MSTLTDIITRCPQCSTAFRATAQVLKIANGTVRCGSCLGVFNAAAHDINSPKQTDTQNTTQDAAEDDESWALELIADEEEPEDIDLDTLSIDTPHADKASPSSQKEAPETTISSPTATKADPKTTSETTPKKPTAPAQAEHTEELIEEHTDSDSLFIDIFNNDLQNDEPETSDEAPTTQDIENTLEIDHSDLSQLNQAHHSLDDITLQPFEEEKHSRQWPWIAGISGMLALIILQTAWIRFDTLSTREPYRHYYSTACELLNCSLPLISDLKQIRTTHLVVRAHPNEKGVLVADAIIVNEAPFEQAFPALELEFRNIHNTLVARRDFQPDEYLKGELIGARIMPAKQAVQLALSIIDPGEDAVNYHINTKVAKKQN